MGRGPVVATAVGVVGLAVGVKRRDAGEARGAFGGFGEVFVTFEADRYADFGFGTRWELCGRNRGLNDAQNTAPAAYRHAFSQGDFGGHAESDLDFSAFFESRICEKKDPARTQILRKPDALDCCRGLA
jgi:hypothetical protein